MKHIKTRRIITITTMFTKKSSLRGPLRDQKLPDAKAWSLLRIFPQELLKKIPQKLKARPLEYCFMKDL